MVEDQRYQGKLLLKYQTIQHERQTPYQHEHYDIRRRVFVALSYLKSIKAWLSVPPRSHLELYSLSTTWKLVFTPQPCKPFRNILGHAVTLMIPTSTPEIVFLLNVSRERQLHTGSLCPYMLLRIMCRISWPCSAFSLVSCSLSSIIFFQFLLHASIKTNSESSASQTPVRSGGPNLLATRSKIASWDGPMIPRMP
jgi:hypothetical protein